MGLDLIGEIRKDKDTAVRYPYFYKLGEINFRKKGKE